MGVCPCRSCWDGEQVRGEPAEPGRAERDELLALVIEALNWAPRRSVLADLDLFYAAYAKKRNLGSVVTVRRAPAREPSEPLCRAIELVARMPTPAFTAMDACLGGYVG